MADAPEQGGGAPAARPRKKPGPPKGVRYGGKKKGSKNKKTLEREKAQQLERERAELEAKAAASGSDVDKARAQAHKLMKDVGMDMTRLAAGLAAYYQPYPQWVADGLGGMKNANPNYDEPRFRYYLEMSLQGARDFAGFESPKLAAHLVQQQVVRKVEVTGGMPDEFAAPVEGQVAFEPGDLVSAEDGVPLKKVVAGEIVSLPVAAKAAS
jgi:hypothetical protein